MLTSITAYDMGVFVHVAAVVAIMTLFVSVHVVLLPRNREAIAALEGGRDGEEEPGTEYYEPLQKMRTTGLIASLVVAVAIFFMVVKP